MNKKQFYIILSVLIIGVLIFSNPSEENHIQTVKSKLKIAFKKKMSSEITENQNDAFATLGSGLGLLLGDTFIDKLTDGLVTRKNYILFSLTNVEFKGEEKIIGFGILGNVFLSDKIENIFQEQEENKVVSETQNSETSDEGYKNDLPEKNQNSSRYEFNDEMLIDKETIKNDLMYNKSFHDEQENCIGVITEVLDGFDGIKVKIIKGNENLKSANLNDGDEWEFYFDNVEYNGKSKMCKSCAEDFKELIKKGRKIEFKAVESLCGGTACAGIWSLCYIKNVE